MHVESIESDDMLSVPVAFAAVRDLDRTHAAGKELSERRKPLTKRLELSG